MVIIGHASKDENNKVSGGLPGDQTGAELCIRSYYNHSKGWRVFRAKDSSVRNKIAEACLQAVNNEFIGYNQNRRDTLWNICREYGYNLSSIRIPCEVDCSSLVRVCCGYAGINLQNFNTSSEPSVLLGSGKFSEEKNIDFITGKGLKIGDILVTRSKGHSVIVVSVEEETTTVKHYPKYSGLSSSIVDALYSVGEQNVTYNNRLKIAKANSIQGYSGRAEQNLYMLTLLKEGKLIKP